MERLLGVVFAILIVIELALVALSMGLLGFFVQAMWHRNPWLTSLGVVLLLAGGFRVVSRRRAVPAPPPAELPPVHPGISIHHIPISGVPGAIYMVQFLVWALVAPAVGIFYAALIAGGLLLVPLAYVVNRPGTASRSILALGVLAFMLALGYVAHVSDEALPSGGLFGVSVVAGFVAAAVLVWWRSRAREQLTLKSYGHPAHGAAVERGDAPDKARS